MEIKIILRRLGICTTYKGYKATVLALTLALEDENRLNSITREIYTEVAKRLGSTPIGDREKSANRGSACVAHEPRRPRKNGRISP